MTELDPFEMRFGAENFLQQKQADPQRQTRGDVVTDPDGTSWRVLAVTSTGTSRVRVGSPAEQAAFDEEQA